MNPDRETDSLVLTSIRYSSGFQGFDLSLACDWLSGTSWGKLRGRAAIERSFRNSWVMHASTGGLQVGFVRVVTDFEFLAYIGDVFVSEPWRRKGVGFRLLKEAMRCPELSGVRTWHATSDVSGFFQSLGFRNINPSRNFVYRNLPETAA